MDERGPGAAGPATDLPTGTVTFLFTDIEGSTDLVQRAGSDYDTVVPRYHDIIRNSVERFEGVIVDTAGDGVFAAFGSASNAVRSAMAAQRELDAEPWPGAIALRVRMGTHTGDVVPHAGRYLSVAVHQAARIAEAAHGGQIVVSDACRALVDVPAGSVSFHDLGMHRLKDLREPLHLHQVGADGVLADFPPLRSLDLVPHNLPVQLTTFVGRRVEVGEVHGLLDEARLVTLVGAGGSGKTRLALQVAAEIAVTRTGGAWLVELAPVSEPDAVLRAVADALHVVAEGDRSPLDLVVDRLMHSDLLLVLDNCEHVLDATADLATELLRCCAHLTILATSRESLQIPGEIAWRVPSLTSRGGRAEESEAVQLFLDRARSADPTWTETTDDDLAIVADICTRLDGIPLAIELATARLDVLGLDELRARLDDRFRLLTSGSRAVLERQRTLRATVDWSHDLLEGPARVLLRRLSVFVGGFTLDTAEQVCADGLLDPLDVLDVLGDLVRKSLVVVDPAARPRRYRMLETVRQYAREKLLDAGEAGAIQDAHGGWIGAHLATVGPGWSFLDIDLVGWMQVLDREHDNLQAALTWLVGASDPTPAAEAVIGAHMYWRIRSHHNEALRWIDAVVERSEIVGRHRAQLLLRGAVHCGQLQLWDLARRSAEEAVAIATELGDARLALHARVLLATYVIDPAARGLDGTYEALALEAREFGDLRIEHDALAAHSLSLVFRNEMEETRRVLDATRRLAVALGDPHAEAVALDHLSVVTWLPDPEVSDELRARALAVARRAGANDPVVRLLTASALDAPDIPAALQLAHEAITLAKTSGSPLSLTGAHSTLARLERARGNDVLAIEHYRAARAQAASVVQMVQESDIPAALDAEIAVCERRAQDALDVLAPFSFSDQPVGFQMNLERPRLAALLLLDRRADIRRIAADIAERCIREARDPMPLALVALAAVDLADGDVVAARSGLREATRIIFTIRRPMHAADAVQVMIAAAVTDDDAHLAGRCAGFLDALSELTEVRSLMQIVPSTLGAEARVRARALDEAAFDGGHGLADGLTMDTLVDYGLDLITAW